MSRQERQTRKKRIEEMTQLRQELAQTKSAIDCAQMNFQQALDPAMVDCYIYEWKAAQLRYQFLLKCVKEYEAGEVAATVS